MNNGRDCAHGQLARSCDRCADAAEIAELRAEVEELRRLRAGGTAGEWSLRGALDAATKEVAALRTEVKELRRGLLTISDCSDDHGAVECANDHLKKLRAEWRKPGGLMDGPFI